MLTAVAWNLGPKVTLHIAHLYPLGWGTDPANGEVDKLETLLCCSSLWLLLISHHKAGPQYSMKGEDSLGL